MRGGAALARIPPVTETRFEELKRSVRFESVDAERLGGFRATAAPHFTRIARELYERVREHEEAHAVLGAEEQIERLQRSVVRWMDRLLCGTYDESYFEEIRNIGRVLVRAGLPQRYLFTAMAVLRAALEDIADDAPAGGARPIRRALSRMIDLDLAIMMESYRESLYDTVTEGSPNLVVGLDRQGGIRLLNQVAQSVTGYALEEVFGSSFVETFVPVDARPKDVPILDRILQGGEKRIAEQSGLKTRSGKVRDVAWTFSRLANGGPADAVVFAVGADVTDTLHASRQLQQNEKLAALGTLAAGLAHEIRNPLNGAQLHVSFLQRALKAKLPEPDLVDAANVVEAEIKRLAQLVSEFLDFARPSALAKKRISIQALLKQALEVTAAESASARVTIALDLPSQELFLFGDLAKLQQVMLNLVQNAVEAITPAPGGNVILRARRHPRYVRIEVEDDGPGLSTPDAPVFDAFFSTKPAGTGLGLAITHRIVTDHGGTIDVESRPGRTCFSFTIPIGTDSTSIAPESR